MTYMRRRTMLHQVLGGALLTLVMSAGFTGSNAAAQDNVLHLGLSKNVNGRAELLKPTLWKCKFGDKTLEMFHQLTYVAGTVQSSGPDCDELPTMLNGKISIRWEVTGRSGRFLSARWKENSFLKTAQLRDPKAPL